MPDSHPSSYRWFMVALTSVTGGLVAALPFSCMPVLFPEIADDLGLSLVQIGAVWGFGNLAGIFISIIAGVLGDRFGVKRVLIIVCILSGITGSLRGFSNDFLTLVITVFLNGFVRLVLPVNLNKVIDIWFRGKNLGVAMGIGAMGIGMGLMLGPMISATVLSPWLGGWRNVMHFYGALSIGVAILWLVFGREPHHVEASAPDVAPVPLKEAFLTLIRNKTLWLIGIALLLRVGGIMGMTGYLPTYLRDKGWEIAVADGTLATFYGVSTLAVVPLSLLSDRLGSRKLILVIAQIVAIICLGLLPVVEGNAVYVLMVLSGIFMDGFMAICITMLLETRGINLAYSGIALGIVHTIGHVGTVASPPLGNSLASINTGLPFFFWAALSVLALVVLLMIKETGWRKSRAIEKEGYIHPEP